MTKKRVAFTLSEVLITLSILGVIAAVTIPSIHRKWQDAYTVTSVRKAYATMDSALRQLYAIEGTPNKWNWSGANNYYKQSDLFMNKLIPYLNVSKHCTALNTYQCLSEQQQNNYSLLNPNCNGGKKSGGFGSWSPMAVLKDGMVFGINNVSTTGFGYQQINNYEKYFATFYFDINGKKGPNRKGYDLFTFAITNKGLLISSTVDWGTIDNAMAGTLVQENCKKSYVNNRSFCGFSCGNYIIKHGNVDYKYKDLTLNEFR